MAGALIYMADTGFSDAVTGTMGLLGVVTSPIRTHEFVAPLVCIHDASLRDVYRHLLVRDLREGAAVVSYTTLGDRIRLVAHLLQLDRSDDNLAVSVSRPAWPATAFLMVEVNPPQVVHPSQHAMTGADRSTYTSGSLYGWYLALSPLLDKLRGGVAPFPDLLELPSGTVSDASLSLALHSMRERCLATPELLGVHFKVVALCVMSSAFAVLGVDAVEHIAWFDLLLAHVHSIVTSDALPASSEEGARRTELSWLRNQSFVSRSALHIVHNARGFDDMSQRLWELALVLVYLLSPSHASSTEAELAEVARTCEAPFTGPMVCLLPGVVADVQRYAPLVCQHYRGALASSRALVLSLPLSMRVGAALQWLLAAQNWEGAAAVVQLETERADRNQPPLVFTRFRDTLPAHLRAVLCDAYGSVQAAGALVFGLTHERDDVLDTLVVAPAAALAALASISSLRALCEPWDALGVHAWAHQSAVVGCLTRSALGLLLWNFIPVKQARVVAMEMARLVVGPPRCVSDARIRVEPLGWLARILAMPSSHAVMTSTHVGGIHLVTQLVRTAMCGDPCLEIDATRLRDVLMLVRTVLSHPERERLREIGEYRFDDITQLATNVSQAAHHRRWIALSPRDGQLLATLFLLSPSIDGGALYTLCTAVRWPVPLSFSRDRLRPMDTSLRLDANARQCAPCGEAIHVRDAVRVLDAFGVPEGWLLSSPAAWLTALCALLHWMEAEARCTRSVSWAVCWNAADTMIRTGSWPAFAVLMHDSERQLGYEAWPDRDCLTYASMRDSAVVSDWFIEALDTTRPWTWHPLRADVPALPPLRLLVSRSDTHGGVASDLATRVATQLHLDVQQPAPVPLRSERFRLFADIDGVPVGLSGEPSGQLLPRNKRWRTGTTGAVATPVPAPPVSVTQPFVFRPVSPVYSPTHAVEPYDPDHPSSGMGYGTMEPLLSPPPSSISRTAPDAGNTLELLSPATLDALLSAVTEQQRIQGEQARSFAPRAASPVRRPTSPFVRSVEVTETMRSRVADAVGAMSGETGNTDAYLATEMLGNTELVRLAEILTSTTPADVAERTEALERLVRIAKDDMYAE